MCCPGSCRSSLPLGPRAAAGDGGDIWGREGGDWDDVGAANREKKEEGESRVEGHTGAERSELRVVALIPLGEAKVPSRLARRITAALVRFFSRVLVSE